MTKVTTLPALMGEKAEQSKEKPIQFVYHVGQASGNCRGAYRTPSEYEQLILISRRAENEKYDVIAAIDGRNATKVSPAIYLGHWNDGVIE